jgi:hypothetical protein
MPQGYKIPEDAQEELRSQRRQRRLAPGPPRGLRGLTPGSSLRGAELEDGESRDPMMFSKRNSVTPQERLCNQLAPTALQAQGQMPGRIW